MLRIPTTFDRTEREYLRVVFFGQARLLNMFVEVNGLLKVTKGLFCSAGTIHFVNNI